MFEQTAQLRRWSAGDTGMNERVVFRCFEEIAETPQRQTQARCPKQSDQVDRTMQKRRAASESLRRHLY